MKNNTYNALRLFAGLLTIAIVVAHQYVPEKRITLLPNSNYPSSIYGPEDTPGMPSAQWIDEQTQHWKCNFFPHHGYSCGYSISFTANDVSGFDLDKYDGLNIKVNYKGDAQRIRVYMRNYNAAYDRGDPLQSSKFLSTIIRTGDLNRNTYVKFSEFSVGEWWIKDFDIPREHVAPEFSNVISMGFDFINHGEHELEIDYIELTGSWIQRESLYLAIIAFWMALIIWEGVNRFYIVYRDSRFAYQKIAKLETDYDLLELKKSEYEALSTTDVLTGVLNRAGIQRILENAFQREQEKSNMGFLLFDIDHFKQVNDIHGHDCGDRILKQLSTLISESVRQRDAFGRWGGEEFVLLCFQIKEEQLLALAEKLRRLVESHEFEQDTPLTVTVSIGATLITSGDSFEGVFKRADLALYDAKHEGRNRVVFKAAQS